MTISIGQITITDVYDGALPQAEYASSTSAITPPATGWGASVPAPQTGYYVWKRERLAYADGTFSAWETPIRVTGDPGATGPAGTSITSVDVEYAISTSNITAPTTGWSTTSPAWEDGKYIWSRTKTTYSTGDPTYTNPACITGGKGETGDIGQGVDSITEEYYLSTSKTTQTGGSWVTTPPTWSTGKYMWTRSKIVYKNPTSTVYTTPVCDSSWEAANEVENNMQGYVQSRGEDLITNGSGLLGDNTNFSAFTFDGSEAYYSSGSFKYVGSSTKFTDEFIPVNPEFVYRLSMVAKTAGGTGRYYAMVATFDVDNLAINAPHHMYRAGTLTTLSQELKNGDTVVHLVDASNWYNDGTVDVSTHLRSIIIWDYVNSFGYKYPALTYSRHWFGNAWDPGAIDYANNTITLKNAWSGGTIPAGTQLSNGSSGWSYKYLAMASTLVPTEWTTYSGVMNGIDLSGTDAGGKFPPGTAKVKIGWLLNYQGSGETIWLTNVSFALATAPNIESQYSTDNANWHDVYTTADKYMRTSNDGGATWSSGMKIVGENGADGSYTEFQFAKNTSLTVAPTTGWQDGPPITSDGEYLWMRTRYIDADGTVGNWTTPVRIKGDEGPQGPQGPPGNPGELGIYADGTTLHVKGFAEDGTLTAPYGYLYVDGARQQVNAYSEALTNSGQGYVLYDGSTIHFAKLVADTASSRWVSYNTLVEYSASMWVIGSFMKTGDTITDIEVLAPERMDVFELRHFMEILHTGDINDINVWAQANGVGTVFEKIAVLEAFVDSLVANEAFIENLFAEDIALGGQIRANYNTAGNIIDSANAGFWLGSNGKFKAQLVELVGQLRTGNNARTDALVAIQDAIGITSGPTFTGSGDNDLSIVSEGSVAGNFKVQITGKNSDDAHWEEVSSGWVTKSVPGVWNDVTVNSAGRFVAVGQDKIAYSDNGINWTVLSVSGNWLGVGVNPTNGRFVAVSWGSVIAYSDDGVNWANVSVIGTWRDVIVNSSGRFVAVGTDKIAYSDDGISWTVLNISGTWFGVTVNSSGRFVAVGSIDKIAYSDNGINWTVLSVSGNWFDVTVNSAGRFVAVGSSKIAYSDNGISWTTVSISGVWNGVTVNSADRFVATDQDKIAYSDNGVSWTIVSVNGTWDGVTVNSAGRFVAVGSNKIIYTKLSDIFRWTPNNGTTWYSNIIIPNTLRYDLAGYGITIAFVSCDGHVINDLWVFTQGAMRGLSIIDSNGDEYFSASNGEIYADNLSLGNVSYSHASSGGTSMLTLSTIPKIGGFISACNGTGDSQASRSIKLPSSGKYLCNIFYYTSRPYNSSSILSGGSTIGGHANTMIIQVFGVRIE